MFDSLGDVHISSACTSIPLYIHCLFPLLCGAPGPSEITAPGSPPAPPTTAVVVPTTPPQHNYVAASDSPGPAQLGV